MHARHIFHLSIPVANLQAARDFYVGVLDAEVGRQNDDWLDILLWGHQITLQHRPAEVLPATRQGKRHFGVVLPWREWEILAERVRTSGTAFLAEPKISDAGDSCRQAKFYLADPGNNVIEVKAYSNVQGTLHLDPAAG
ncbi:MAG TPA: VOC family protein [Rhodanobacteraceae bacterium]